MWHACRASLHRSHTAGGSRTQGRDSTLRPANRCAMAAALTGIARHSRCCFPATLTAMCVILVVSFQGGIGPTERGPPSCAARALDIRPSSRLPDGGRESRDTPRPYLCCAIGSRSVGRRAEARCLSSIVHAADRAGRACVILNGTQLPFRADMDKKNEPRKDRLVIKLDACTVQSAPACHCRGKRAYLRGL